MSARLASCALVMLSFVVALAVTEHTSSRATAPMTTKERLRQNTWWPTKALSNQQDYVGADTCKQCHSAIVKLQQTSQMARTLVPAASSTVVASHSGKIFEFGGYSYALQSSGQNITMSVTNGVDTRSANLQWAFGSGETGQSYLWQKDGQYNESRFNYFSSIHGFAATPGRLHGTPINLDMAVSRRVADFEARTCFSCHTTGLTSSEPLSSAQFVPGVTCEACHGPGKRHVEAMMGGESGNDLHIVNPVHLTPADAVDFCGACHSSSKDVELMGAVGEPTVRFPAYRLSESRCWGKNGDSRITCFACHNPHQPLAQQAATYDSACLRCHLQERNAKPHGEQVGSACPVAKTNCVTCHMPKIEVADMHYKFTDHRIRVVKAGAQFPD